MCSGALAIHDRPTATMAALRITADCAYHGPHDPRELIRDGHRGDIAPAPLLGLDRPLLQRRGPCRRLRVPDDRTGAVCEEHANVHVAPLADGAEPAPRPAGVFLGRQAEEAREMSSGRKTPDVCDEGDQRGGGEHPDARDGLQERHVGQLGCECPELSFDGTHIRLEHLNLVTGRGEGRVQYQRHRGQLVHQRPDARDDVLGADWDEDAEFAQ
jgi:hypothetical protein